MARVVTGILTHLFERSEFLIATCEKIFLTVCVDVCVDVRLILVLVCTYVCFLVLVWKNCLGFSVGYQRAPSTSEKKKNAWYQRALRCQLRGRPFHPLRFSGAATLTQSSSFSCGAGLQSESRLLRCCAATVYMLAADAAVAAAVFSLEHLISYCNHTKRCFGPTSRRRKAAGRGSPYTAPSLTGRGMLLVRGLPLRV